VEGLYLEITTVSDPYSYSSTSRAGAEYEYGCEYVYGEILGKPC
jgi:hypothetical protein